MAIAAFEKLGKNQQLAVLIAIPLAVAVAIIALMWGDLGKLGPDPKLPTFVQRKLPTSTYAQIAALDTQILQQDTIIREGPDVQRKLNGLAADIKKAEDRLPTEAEKTNMRSLISKMANDLPAEIGKVQYLGVKIIESAMPDRGRSPNGDYQTITYQTDISGDLHGIIKYIDTIEKNTRFMAVKSLSIKPGGISLNETGDHIAYAPHRAFLDIVTYVYIPPQTKAGVK